MSMLFCVIAVMGCKFNVNPPDPQDLETLPDTLADSTDLKDLLPELDVGTDVPEPEAEVTDLVPEETESDTLDLLETTEELETHIDALDVPDIFEVHDLLDAENSLDQVEEIDQLDEQDVFKTLDLLEIIPEIDAAFPDIAELYEIAEITPEIEVLPEVVDPCPSTSLYWDEHLEECLLYPCCEIGNADQPWIWTFSFVNTAGFPWQTYLYEAKIMQDQAYIEFALLKLDNNAPDLPALLIGTMPGDNMELIGGQENEVGVLTIMASDVFNDLLDGDLNGSYMLEKTGSPLQVGTWELFQN